MNGKDFKLIRKANKISRRQISEKTNKTDFTIRFYEKSDYVPALYVNALSELIKQDLTNSVRVERIIKEIPDSVKNKKKNDIWNVKFI